MKAVLALLVSGLLVASPGSAATSDSKCRPIAGWDAVLANRQTSWIVIGELHGTAETPAAFADAVCLTAEQRGPVVVALEQPSSDQPAIDAFIASDGGAGARAAFFEALMWHMPMKDGRSSQAFFALVERLRQMHAEGRVARVVAFVDSRPPGQDPPGDQGPYEKRLAAIVRDAAAPGATVLVLVGNLHASKTETGFARRFMPMASHLPPERTVTLNAVGNGGAAWVCQADGCGSHANGRPGQPTVRGVVLRPVMDGAYDGVLELGVATTASPPQPTT